MNFYCKFLNFVEFFVFFGIFIMNFNIESLPISVFLKFL
jgi:hypothetical protein